MSNVIEIGDFSIARKSRSYGFVAEGECAHRRTTMEEDGEIVRCRDCKAQLTAWWLLKEILYAYTESQRKAKIDREQIAKERATIIHLIAARKVERAWRHHTMLPTCPHCHRGIAPTDGFGDGMVNKKIERTHRIADGKRIRPC